MKAALVPSGEKTSVREKRRIISARGSGSRRAPASAHVSASRSQTQCASPTSTPTPAASSQTERNGRASGVTASPVAAESARAIAA